MQWCIASPDPDPESQTPACASGRSAPPAPRPPPMPSSSRLVFLSSPPLPILPDSPLAGRARATRRRASPPPPSGPLPPGQTCPSDPPIAGHARDCDDARRPAPACPLPTHHSLFDLSPLLRILPAEIRRIFSILDGRHTVLIIPRSSPHLTRTTRLPVRIPCLHRFPGHITGPQSSRLARGTSLPTPRCRIVSRGHPLSWHPSFLLR